MATRRNSKPAERESPDTVHASAGHVEVDARGHSVWRWGSQSPLDSTTILLKRLENDALELEASSKLPSPAAGKARGRPRATSRHAWEIEREHEGKDAGGGFDPYNNT